MKFLVTGGAGFIGSHITKRLLSLDETSDVIVVDNLRRGKLDNLNDIKDKINFFQYDILNYEKMKSILEQVDCIFHQAALGSVPDSFKYPEEYHRTNVEGTENIFKIASDLGIKVIYASSSSIYGDPECLPIPENHPKKPKNPYGKTKLEAEDLAKEYHENKGASIICLRYFNVYGIGQNPNYAGVIPRFMDRLKDKKPPIIFGDGSQVRSFTFVEDVVDANIQAYKKQSLDYSYLNIGGREATTVGDLAEMMIEISGLDLKPEYDAPREGDITLSRPDISKAKEVLGWEAKTTLCDGLQRIFATI